MSPSVVAVDERAEGERPVGEPVDLERWRALAESVLVAEGVDGPAELSLVFESPSRMAELNATFMGEAGPTDVLSFPLDAELVPSGAAGDEVLRLLGDVVVCPAVAARNASGHTGGYDGEMALLVVHGVLHVLGMDHADPAEAAAMVDRERAHLSAVGIERRP